MKKRLRCVMSLVLVICMVIGSAMPVMAYEAGDTEWQNDFYYDVVGENIILKGYKNNKEIEDLYIPSEAVIDGAHYKVKLSDDCSGFFGHSTMKTVQFSNEIDTSNVLKTNNMFNECEELTSVDLSSFNTGNVADMGGMFCKCTKLSSLNLRAFDTTNVTDMGCMFDGCSSLSSLNLSNFNTSNVTNMHAMFRDCSELASLDLSGFNTANVEHMGEMFYGCSGLTGLDLSSFDTRNVENMNSMFCGCRGLKSINLNSFNTSKVTHMGGMFEECSSLSNLDVTGFDTCSVNDMQYMFHDCSSLNNLDLRNFDTSHVKNIESMFEGCTNLAALNVSGWNTGNVENLRKLLFGCSKLTSIDMSTWNLNKPKGSDTYLGDVFTGCTSLNTIQIPRRLNSGRIVLPRRFVKQDDISMEYTSLPEGQDTSFTIIRKDDVIYVTGITVSLTKKTIDVGDKFNMVATVTPDNATNKLFSWSSDEPAVASVDNYGNVTGLSEGNAKITVKTVDGNYKAVCDVTVSEAKHDYKYPVFKWSSDNKSCKVTYTCDGTSCHGNKHTVTYDCDVTTDELTPATCTKKGIERYIATYGDDKDVKVLKDLPITDEHDYDYNNPEFSWSKDRKKCTVTYYCKNDIDHYVTYDCDVTSEVVTPATCENKGTTKYTATYKDDKDTKITKNIPKITHACEEVITKASTTSDGKMERVCTECEEVISSTPIYKIASMSISSTNAIYNGKAFMPTVTVLDSKGNVIDSKYYAVTYSNNTKVGTGTVKVSFKGRYKGSLSKTFTIIPKKTLITAASSPKKGSMKVTWNKQATETTGYEIQVSPVTNFKKNVKTVNVAKPATTAKTITGLKKGKNYIRIRTYKIVNGTKYYSAWSKYSKAVTVK